MNSLESILRHMKEAGLDDVVAKVEAAAGKAKDHEIPNTNLYIRGFGMDENGNSVVYVSILDGRRSSIQTNDEDLKNTHNHHDMSIFDSGDKETIKKIEDEVLEYVKKYGDPSIKNRLKLYGKRKESSSGKDQINSQTNETTVGEVSINTVGNLINVLNKFDKDTPVRISPRGITYRSVSSVDKIKGNEELGLENKDYIVVKTY